MSKRSGMVCLVVGVLVVATGIFGIYYQGPFWTSETWTVMNGGELGLAYGLPSIVSVIGVAMVSVAILHSDLTLTWKASRKMAFYCVFIGLIVVSSRYVSIKAGTMRLDHHYLTQDYYETRRGAELDDAETNN